MYVNGKIHGKHNEYYESGAIKFTHAYTNGERHGKSIGYDEAGIIEFSHVY